MISIQLLDPFIDSFKTAFAGDSEQQRTPPAPSGTAPGLRRAPRRRCGGLRGPAGNDVRCRSEAKAHHCIDAWRRRRRHFGLMFLLLLDGRSAKFQQDVARFRLYRHRFLQENTRFAAFFKIYQIIYLQFLKYGKILQILQHNDLQIFC